MAKSIKIKNQNNEDYELSIVKFNDQNKTRKECIDDQNLIHLRAKESNSSTSFCENNVNADENCNAKIFNIYNEFSANQRSNRSKANAHSLLEKYLFDARVMLAIIVLLSIAVIANFFVTFTKQNNGNYIEEIQSELNEAKSVINSIQIELINTNAEIISLKHEIIDIKSALTETKIEVNNIKVSLLVIEAEINFTENSLVYIEDKINDINFELSETRVELNQTNASLILNKAEINQIKNDLVNIENDTNSNLIRFEFELNYNQFELNYTKTIALDNQVIMNDTISKLIENQEDINYTKSKVENIEDEQYLVNAKVIELNDEMMNTQTSLNNIIKRTDVLEYNTVPVGFIYFQLPEQQEPQNIWSFGEWSEVSAEYAGLFFRVIGGGSEAFGVTQNENSNRLTNVNSMIDDDMKSHDLVVTPGVWSDWVTLGAWAGNNVQTRFLLSGGEIRPSNKAIRIWKRIS